MPQHPGKQPGRPPVALPSRLLAWLHAAFSRTSQWINAHPGKAQLFALLLVFIVVGSEANYWPSHNFPGALWHHSPRGDDIELAQANAAKAGWPELWSYWYGPMIHGHGYYRPITSWLFVLEYRLFGTADGTWAFVSIALHLAVCLLLAWAGGVLAGGSSARRLGIGTGAALLVGAPFLADRGIQAWICGWWPCQSEMLSLLGGLTLLAATVRFIETGRGRWLTLGTVAMVLGVLCKEMTYVAALGACLLLVRHRRRWWAGFVIAGPAVLLFLVRKWAIRNVPVEGGIPMDDVWNRIHFNLSQTFVQLQGALLNFGALAVAAVISGMVLRRSGWLEKALATVFVYLALVGLLLGPPWESGTWAGHRTVLEWVWGLVVLAGLLRAMRRWPVPELCVIWLLTQLPALGFMPIFAWYRYWSSVFGALLIAIALWELAGWKLAPLIPSPTRNRPGTPESLPPAADGSLASGPSAA